jgi:hypothetical protein
MSVAHVREDGVILPRRWLALLALLVIVSCGGNEYSIAGAWQIISVDGQPAVLGTMLVRSDFSGSYTPQGGGAEALTAHTFSRSRPDFVLTFGSTIVAGHLLAEGDSHVFNGTVGPPLISGLFAHSVIGVRYDLACLSYPPAKDGRGVQSAPVSGLRHREETRCQTTQKA